MKAAYLNFWAGVNLVVAYPSQKILTTSMLSNPMPAIRRANRRGYHVKVFTSFGSKVYGPKRKGSKGYPPPR